MGMPLPFKALIVASKAGDHLPMSAGAEPFFAQMAQENGFTVDFSFETDTINTRNLEPYRVFVMLHLAPFEMTSPQQEALQSFIESGRGWVGIHAAGLAGKQFVGSDRTYWQWFEEFLGGVTYSPHPAYQQGTVLVEDRRHPATRNLPARFAMSDEWYEFNGNPRGRVRVLATADETSYKQNRPMGDHPIIWTNEGYRRAIYIGPGHDPSALTNEAYRILLRDSVLWAASE
jgi:type 1 glutamine amidotransferase